MTSFVRRLNEFLLRLVKKLRDEGHTNAFVGDRFQGHGGIAAQMYFQGLFELDRDEVLILESELPATVHYWSVQLVDPFYSAIDFIFHSAAFNGMQAHVSSDGKAALRDFAGGSRSAELARPCGLAAGRDVLALAQCKLVSDAVRQARQVRGTAASPAAGHTDHRRCTTGGGAGRRASRTTSHGVDGEDAGGVAYADSCRPDRNQGRSVGSATGCRSVCRARDLRRAVRSCSSELRDAGPVVWLREIATYASCAT